MFQFELQAHAESLHFRTEPFSDERKENVFGRKYAVLSSSEALDGYNFLFQIEAKPSAHSNAKWAIFEDRTAYFRQSF